MWKAFSVLKIKSELKTQVDNLVFRLHYRYTVLIFMGGAILATLYDFVGEKIICMVDTNQDSLKKVVNSYCYITGTYTVDHLHYKKVGLEVPFPGVGPHTPDDAITYHTYYQWVPFVLLGQGALFYGPHMLWKVWERGLFKSIIQNLSIKDYLGGKNIGNYFTRESQFHALSVYITQYMHSHRGWAIKFVFCEVLNLVVVIFTIFFTNWFLGGEFFTYGTRVFEMMNMDPENRTDPMSEVFPRMGKCLFRMYGPSGTIERRDVMCLLPTNIANEKIYVVVWVWLAGVSVVTFLWLLIRMITFIKIVRDKVFMIRVYNIPRINTSDYEVLGRHLATRTQVETVLRQADFSDTLLLSQLGDNMEASMFSEFIAYLAKYMAMNGATLRRRDKEESEDEDNAFEMERMKKKEEAMLEGNHPYIKPNV